MKNEIGSRVGAIMGSKKDGTIDFFGYGIYEGDFCPKEAVGGMAEIAREIPGYTNPRIKLDSGKVVYGCECWWGPEEKIKKMLDGKTVINVDIDKIRSDFK